MLGPPTNKLSTSNIIASKLNVDFGHPGRRHCHWESDTNTVTLDISSLSAGDYTGWITNHAWVRQRVPDHDGVFVVLDLTESDNILHVPSEYATIQLAINAAEAGDIVLVESNIYAEDLVTKRNVRLAITS